MEWMKNFFSNFFKAKNEPFEYEPEDTENYEWDWDSLTKERNLFKLTDELQREKYIRSLIEQVKDASTELDKLSNEYNMVTAFLKDMEELEAIPKEQKDELIDSAKRILYFEGEKREYNKRKNRMTDSQFHSMERIEENMPKAYNDLKQAEDYKALIREDLGKLDGEKQAYFYRQAELQRDIANCKGMVTIGIFAMVLCTIMLLILQLGFHMDTKIGYIIVVFAGAIAITVLYLKYLDYTQELAKIQKGINRIILLQNTVKIRYVNNTNLLEYLYMKYNTTSAKELLRLWNLYQDERKEREINVQNEQELSYYEGELLKKLRMYQLNDVYAWVHNPLAIMDHNEMVEIRHTYIQRRQKLRTRMDYNKRLAKDGEKEIKEFSRNYPQYAKEVLDLVKRY